MKRLFVSFFCLNLTLNIFANFDEDFVDIVNELRNELEGKPTMLAENFDTHFSYYFKYCSMSRYRSKKNWGLVGGIPGHSVFYLKGVCLDKNKGPSGLSLCEENSNFKSSETGVGLSTNKHLKNVNFMVFPGLKRFFGNEVKSHEKFDWELKNKIIARTLKTNVFDGVNFYSSAFPRLLLPEHETEYMARNAFGTDFSIKMARDLSCVTLPMNRGVMGVIVDYLNELNLSYENSQGTCYRGGTKKDNSYHWDGFYDNCTHTPIKSLAKVGVLDSMKTNASFFKQISNVAIPAPTLINIHNVINDNNWSIDKFYHDSTLKRMIIEYQWFPQMLGGFVEYIPMHANNDYYVSDETVLLMPWKKLKNLLRDSRYSYHGGGDKGLVVNFFNSYLRLKSKLNQINKVKSERDYKKKKKLSILAAIKTMRSGVNYIKNQLDRSTPDKRSFKKLSKQLKSLKQKLKVREKALDYVDFIANFEFVIRKSMLFLEMKIAKIIIDSEA